MAKEVTNEDLARVVQKGFEGVDKQIENLATMTAKGFEETASKVDLQKVETRLDRRLDRIENLLIRDHNNRIERLEDKVRVLETALRK